MPSPEPLDGVEPPDEPAHDRSFIVVAERLLLEPEVLRWLDAERPTFDDDEPPQAA